LESAKFSGDEGATTLHLAAYLEGEVVGVASFYEEPFPDEQVLGWAYRLRGMATDPYYQRRYGIGSQLLEAAWPLLKVRGVEVVWCYARVEAVPFYEKRGFLPHRAMGVIEIPDVGPHEVWYYPLAKGAERIDA
jgi:ribosomal protein S18 acetylase RimI-like enzyme